MDRAAIIEDLKTWLIGAAQDWDGTVLAREVLHKIDELEEEYE